MFESIRNSLANRINDATTRYDESVRNVLLDKLRLMQSHVGTPHRNHTFLKEHYMRMDVQKNYWFTNVRTAVEFETFVEQQALLSTQKDSTILQVLESHPNQIRFVPTSNLVVVPESILQRPELNLGYSHMYDHHHSYSIIIAIKFCR